MPKGWKEVKLGEVINHQKGYAFKSDSYITEGVRIIRISDTTRNSIHDNSPVYIDENETASLSQYKLNAEDIILSTVGSRPHLLDSMVGKAVKVPVKDRGALLNQNLVKIVPKNSLITNNYLFSMITKSKFNYFISTLVRGNANQVSITLKELFAYTFPLPPLPEQQKIAKILSTWDKAISATERLIDNSTQQKKALMQQLLTGKKRLLDESGKRFEDEWEESTLGSICKFSQGFQIGVDEQTSEQEDGLVRFIRIVDYTKESEPARYIAPKSNYYKVDKHDVVMVRYGEAGLTCRGYEGVIANNLFLISPDKAKLSKAYLFKFLRYNFKKISVLAASSTMPALKFTDLKTFKIQIPKIDEQQKISTVLTNADKEIELLEQQLADLQQEKKALMHQLLTGQKRVVVDGE